MQVAPQPHGPAVCFLEDDDLDRKIPNVWGFQLSDSVTTQPLAESNLSTPLVNFSPLSEDRGLSSYPPQRLLSSCLTVSGPSTAVSAASDPSVVYRRTSSGLSVVCRPTSGTNAVSVTISGPSAVRVNDSGPSAVCVVTSGFNAASVVAPGPYSSVAYSTPPGPSADRRRLPRRVLPSSNPFAHKCKQSLAQSRVTELSLAPNNIVWGTVNSQPPGK